MSPAYTPRIAKADHTHVEHSSKSGSDVSPILGVLMVASWIALGAMFMMVHPDHIADVLFPQSFLPAVSMVALSGYATFAYLRKSSFKGAIASLSLSVIFWLLLRGLLSLPALVYVIAPWAIVELILTITRER